jgi:hypothetical protein
MEKKNQKMLAGVSELSLIRSKSQDQSIDHKSKGNFRSHFLYEQTKVLTRTWS